MKKDRRKEILPDSSALINLLPTLRYFASATGEPFPVLAALPLQSFG
jgi:hypothetical protein